MKASDAIKILTEHIEKIGDFECVIDSGPTHNLRPLDSSDFIFGERKVFNWRLEDVPEPNAAAVICLIGEY